MKTFLIIFCVGYTLAGTNGIKWKSSTKTLSNSIEESKFENKVLIYSHKRLVRMIFFFIFQFVCLFYLFIFLGRCYFSRPETSAKFNIQNYGVETVPESLCMSECEKRQLVGTIVETRRFHFDCECTCHYVRKRNTSLRKHK